MSVVKVVISSALAGLTLLIIMIGIIPRINVEADMNHGGTPHANNEEQNSKETIIIYEDEVLISLQEVLEDLGSKVVYDQSTEELYFDLVGQEYVCTFVALNSNFPDRKKILISSIENKGSLNNNDYIQLNPMSADGVYHLIDNKVYLNQQTGQRLFEALGYAVTIDVEQKRILLQSQFD